LFAQGSQFFPEQVFPDQVTTNLLAQNVVYATGTVGALFIVAGVMLVDLGGVRRVNVMESVIQKLIGFFIGFTAYFGIGYAIWQWQYYVAFDVANPYWESIKDWWLGGSMSNEMAHRVDPDILPALNNEHIFIFFLACFAGLINVLIHLSVTERIKPGAYYIVALVAALVSSALSWLTWGSTGPLTNLGYHDFFGAGFVYVFVGAMAVVLARRVGPRPGMFKPHPRVRDFHEYNLGLSGTGLFLIFAGLPMVIISCGFFIDPEALYISINMSDTSVGRVFNNLGLAWAGGALVGALIAYLTKKYIYVLLGPLAGYLSGAAGFDIFQPWQMFLIALGGPIVAFAVYEFAQRRQIDEHKAIPLFLGCGSYGIIMAGIVGWGTPQSGFVGIEEGPYAFQNAEVTLWWQLLGLGVVIATGVVTAWVLCFVLERTIGLRVPEDVEVVGFDQHVWDVSHDVEPQPAPTTTAHGSRRNGHRKVARTSGNWPRP
jgi:ammonia channel protein AmtB